MKYYICVNDMLKEATKDEYAEWDENNPKSFLYPDYTKEIGDRVYTVQTMFEGDLQDEDEVRPFVIEFLEDSKSQVVEEFKRRYREIIDMIEQKGLQAGV